MSEQLAVYICALADLSNIKSGVLFATCLIKVYQINDKLPIQIICNLFDELDDIEQIKAVCVLPVYIANKITAYNNKYDHLSSLLNTNISHIALPILLGVDPELIYNNKYNINRDNIFKVIDDTKADSPIEKYNTLTQYVFHKLKLYSITKTTNPINLVLADKILKAIKEVERQYHMIENHRKSIV